MPFARKPCEVCGKEHTNRRFCSFECSGKEPLSHEGKAKVLASLAASAETRRGKKRSEATKAKIAASHKGKKLSAKDKAFRTMTLKNAHHLREKAKKFHRDFEAEPLKEGEIKCAGRRPGYDCNHTNQSSYYWHPLGVCGACFQYLYRTRQLGRDGPNALCLGTKPPCNRP